MGVSDSDFWNVHLIVACRGLYKNKFQCTRTDSTVPRLWNLAFRLSESGRSMALEIRFSRLADHIVYQTFTESKPSIECDYLFRQGYTCSMLLQSLDLKPYQSVSGLFYYHGVSRCRHV